MKLTSLDDYIKMRMKSPEFRREFEEAGKQYKTAIEIYDLRKELGLSRQQVSQKSGISKKKITRIEQGDIEITDKNAKVMAQVLQCLGTEGNSSLAYQK
ncbi:MAG TPA: hypothetical protein DCW31_02445 [Lactobacillus sp.]|nr:hypothetical protein [Lactobacillus sp.]